MEESKKRPWWFRRIPSTAELLSEEYSKAAAHMYENPLHSKHRHYNPILTHSPPCTLAPPVSSSSSSVEGGRRLGRCTYMAAGPGPTARPDSFRPCSRNFIILIFSSATAVEAQSWARRASTDLALYSLGSCSEQLTSHSRAAAALLVVAVGGRALF